MEDIYTIKVKTGCDPRAKYPSERRYSASTVFGLAWVHLALAATSFLLACLALVNPNSSPVSSIIPEDGEEFDGATGLIVAPCLLTLAALASGLAAVLASKRWYIDQNIAWLLAASALSAALSLAGVCVTAAWLASATESGDAAAQLSEESFFDRVQLVSNSSDGDSFVYLFKVPKYETMPTALASTVQRQSKSRRVLSINILVAAILELLWSLLTVKIAWRGTRNNYPDDDAADRRGGNRMEVVTEIKGNNTKYVPKNARILPPKPDLVAQYPTSGKVKKFFIAQQELGRGSADFPAKESGSEYRERMFSFLNRCTSFDQGSACASADLDGERRGPRLSWGDAMDHTVYDQNTLTFNKLGTGSERR